MAEGIADSAKQVITPEGINNRISINEVSGKSKNGNSAVEHKHSGTVRLEGVDNDNQVIAVVDIVMGELRKEARI